MWLDDGYRMAGLLSSPTSEGSEGIILVLIMTLPQKSSSDSNKSDPSSVCSPPSSCQTKSAWMQTKKMTSLRPLDHEDGDSKY